jgi:hypothetical protein
MVRTQRYRAYWLTIFISCGTQSSAAALKIRLMRACVDVGQMPKRRSRASPMAGDDVAFFANPGEL